MARKSSNEFEKCAVMSDVHANPRSLATALEDARALGCDRFVMLGDTTGYGYDAAGALKLVKESFDVVLLGNHDSACLGMEPPIETELNRNYALDVAQRSVLADADKEWLRKRPLIYRAAGGSFVHGNFTTPRAWRYVFNDEDAEAALGADDAPFLFCGHTHHVAAWILAKGKLTRKFSKRLWKFVSKPEKLTLTLPEGARAVVNVGSVGYPRNDFCISYAIYEPAARKVTLRRLPFHFSSYIEDMSSSGVVIPGWLVKFLVDMQRRQQQG